MQLVVGHLMVKQVARCKLNSLFGGFIYRLYACKRNETSIITVAYCILWQNGIFLLLLLTGANIFIEVPSLKLVNIDQVPEYQMPRHLVLIACDCSNQIFSAHNNSIDFY